MVYLLLLVYFERDKDEETSNEPYNKIQFSQTKIGK